MWVNNILNGDPGEQTEIIVCKVPGRVPCTGTACKSGEQIVTKEDSNLKDEDPTLRMGAQGRGSIIAKYSCLTVTFCRMFVLKIEE